jgi:hypothetical protein
MLSALQLESVVVVRRREGKVMWGRVRKRARVVRVVG